MQLWVYSAAKSLIESEMDIQGSNFVEDDEMMGYFNTAIDDAEKIILELHEDYFLSNDYVALVEDEDQYDMPSDIYANKLRYCFFQDNGSGTAYYDVERIKLKNIPTVGADDDYQYNIEHGTAGGSPKFVLYPPARETSSTKLRRFYIRNANRITAETDVIDIPEFIEYVFAHVREKVALKQRSSAYATYLQKVGVQEQKMRTTLSTMVLDGSSEVMEPDTEHYDDSEA